MARKPPPKSPAKGRPPERRGPKPSDRRSPPERGARPSAAVPARPEGAELLYGVHAVSAALSNAARRIVEVLATRQSAEKLVVDREIEARLLSPAELDALCGDGSVHQGVAAFVRPLPALDLETTAAPAEAARPVLVLDQITDPRNIGAILRSAAAFAARCVVVHDRSTPALDGALAKAAAGAVETVPVVRATNIARALESLQEIGYRTVGLAGETRTALADAVDDGPLAIALGAEGPGLRRLVREKCDVLARIPMPGEMESLNVSVAAAIALYEAGRSS